MATDPGHRSFGALRLVSQSANDGAQPATGTAPADQALLAAVRAGEPKVATHLYDRLSPQVDRTIRRLLGRYDSDAEDLAQISLVEIVNTIAAFRGDCSLDRWAQTVTAHIVFKHIRRRSLERRLFSELLADDVHAGPVQLEHLSVSREFLARISDLLDDMNPPRVWAFLLHDVMGYDLNEIAEMTSTSRAAAQSRLSRGRRELHQRIARDPDLVDLLGNLTGSATSPTALPASPSSSSRDDSEESAAPTGSRGRGAWE